VGYSFLKHIDISNWKCYDLLLRIKKDFIMRRFFSWAVIFVLALNFTALGILGWLHRDRIADASDFSGEWLYTDTTFDVVWKFNHDQSFEMYHTGIDIVSAGYWWDAGDNLIKVDTMPMGETSTPLCYRYRATEDTLLLKYAGPGVCPGVEDDGNDDLFVLTRF